MAKLTQQRLVPFGAILVASIALGACGGDSPAAMEQQLSSAAPTLAFVDDDQAPCAGQAILTTVGYEQLAADGHTSELLAEDPALVESIFADHDSADLREALNNCVDTSSLFQNQLVMQTGGDALVCDTTFSADDPVVDEYLDDRFTDNEASINIDDTAETRNLLRPCLTEESFAKQFGVDLAVDLGPAITQALPTAVHAEECAGSEIVDTFGAERLNELGLTVQSPKFTLDELDLETKDQNAILEAVTACSGIDDARRAELRSEEPSLGDCAVDAAGEKWKRVAVAAELGEGRQSAPEWLLDDAVADCAIETAEEIVGRSITSSERAAARNRATILAVPYDEFDEYSATRSMLECAMFVAAAELGVDEFSNTFDSLWFAETDDAAYDAMKAFGDMLLPARRTCEGDSIFALVEFHRAGFSEETIDCVARDVGGVEHLADLYETVSLNPDATEAEDNAFYFAATAPYEAIADCYSSDEAAEYRAFQSVLNNVGLGEEPNDSF